MDSSKSHKHLSLSEAQRLGLIDEFVRQQEANGIGPICRADFDALTGALVKERRSANQTSHSSSGDGSRGTGTRRGKRPSASD